jgi:serine/threonine protein kinase
VIHGGLEPDRIVITPERRYPLCIPDWSYAITHDATAHVPPQASAQMASEESRHYLAPELAGRESSAAHEHISDRADMFALGVIAYRALAGDVPCTPGRDPGRPYISAHERRPDLPSELAAIIDPLLAFDRFDRPSAAVVRDDLDRLFETLPELQAHAASRREPLPAIARGSHADAEALPEGAAVAPEAAEGLPWDIVPLHQPRLRRPRWTPGLRYLEVTPGEINTEKDFPK